LSVAATHSVQASLSRSAAPVGYVELRDDGNATKANGPIGSHCHSRYGWASIERQAGGRSAAASGFSGPGLG